MSGELRDAVRRKASPLQTLRAVAWSFFGIRRGAQVREDVSQLNPLHVVIAGVAAAAVFVGALIVFVNWVVGSGFGK